VRRAVGSVAVLPFENVGGDPKLEYLSAGLADLLIISLSHRSVDKSDARNSENAIDDPHALLLVPEQRSRWACPDP
jgi:TolB-like protein